MSGMEESLSSISKTGAQEATFDLILKKKKTIINPRVGKLVFECMLDNVRARSAGPRRNKTHRLFAHMEGNTCCI